MGLNHEKHTPLFSYYVFKSVSEKLKKFRDDELINNSQSEAKQYRQIIEQEIDDIDY